jgi:phosphotriesterase-related protein
MVATMRGEVTPEQLGTTLMHEHVFVVNPEVAANFPTGWNEDAAVSRAVERMAELRAAGVDTIVDLTVVGIGRDIPRLQRVAAATDL